MKRTTMITIVGGVMMAFAAGHLTAQPPAARPPAKAPTISAAQQAFLADYNAAANQNNDAKVTRLMAEAAGDAELTDVLVEKLWNYEDKNDPRAETLQTTLAIQQRQRQIELLEEVLAELKKNQQPKN